MNKRITSIVLSLVMLFTMLATAVPVFAATPVALKVTADTTSAHPGDTINYKVFVGAVTNMGGLEFRLNIPSGLTIVDDSISIPTGLETTIDSDGAIVVPKSGNGYKWSYSAQMTGYTGSSDLVILNFACTVDDGASGDKIVTINVDTFFDNDPPYPELDYTVTPATVNVTAAPVAVTGVTIDETLSVNIGQTKTPSFTVAPAEATNKTVSFTSDNPAVATVNATTGEVTGVKKGTATITVKTADGNFTDTCTVTVSCAHTNKSTVSAQDSTCTVKGWDEHKKCDDCGQLFDKNGNEIDAVPTRSLAAHTAQHHARVEPTHAAAGNIEYWTCSVCNKYFSDAACTAEITQEQTVLNKIEHSFGSDWKSNADQHWHECSCGEKNAIANHTFEWKTDTAATEDATGLKHEECTDCHYKRNENTVIPKLEHTHAWQETPAKASTCTEQGNNQYFYCTKCEKYFKANKVTETTVAAETLPLASHTESSWKSDANGHWKECTKCGAITTEKVAHTPDREAATETDPIKCSVCDDVITPALGHTHTGGGGSYYAPVVPDMPMLYRGCTGDAVKTLQDKLNALGYNSGNVDGIFGAKTYAAVTAFQKANSLGVDGIVGKLTWGKLYGISPAMPVETTTVVGRPMVSYGSRGDAVRKLQELLNALGYDCGSVDGIFGSKTKAAVLAFQKANGLGVDGIVGPLTWAKLG